MRDSGRFRSLLVRDRQHRAERERDEPTKRSLCRRIDRREEEWGLDDHKTHGLGMRRERELYLHEAQGEMTLRNNPCSLRGLAGD